MSAKPETNFRQNTVIPFLKTLRNTVFFPIQQVAILGDADFFLCAQGAFIWLELKSEDGVQSKVQKYKASEVQKCSGVVIVASPDNWPEAKKILLRLNHGESE